MLILKGKSQKSVLANILMDKTNSICYQYYNAPVVLDSICVDSTEYSLKDFIGYVIEEFKRNNADEPHYDYLIIYTNEKEEDLIDLIEWFDEYRWRVSCRDILIMCK